MLLETGAIIFPSIACGLAADIVKVQAMEGKYIWWVWLGANRLTQRAYPHRSGMGESCYPFSLRVRSKFR